MASYRDSFYLYFTYRISGILVSALGKNGNKTKEYSGPKLSNYT
jgi:hypothetical protein